MAKSNRDEFDLDTNGNKKQALQKGLITKDGDVSRLISDFTNQVNSLRSGFMQLSDGKDYAAGEDSLTKLTALLSGGPQVKFYEQYKNILSNPQKASAFENSNDDKLSASEKMAMTDFYRLMDATKELRSEFASALRGDVYDKMLPAYQVIRMQNKMFQNIKSYTVDEIEEAFYDFAGVMFKFEGKKVYDSMVINRKYYSVNEAIDVVLDYMGVYIEDTKNLKKYLWDARKINASGINFLYSIDRDTLELSRLVAKKEDIRNVANIGSKLKEQVDAFYDRSTSDNKSYLDSLKYIIDLAFNVFKRAFNEIDYFETEKSHAPQSIVHPEKKGIGEWATRYNLGRCDNYLKEGSNYCELFRMMITRMKQVAAEIAANAPD